MKQPKDNLLCTTCWLVGQSADVPACRSCGSAAPVGGWNALPYVFRERYRFEQLLGRGGMGAVFKAYDLQADAQSSWVAVKVAQLKGRPGDQEKLKEAFVQEGRAAAMLSKHKEHFVGFRGSDPGDPAYLALEFVEWPTLKELREKAGTLPPLDVALVGVQILRGVRFMERRRMVHRDIKPENIFVNYTPSVPTSADRGSMPIFEIKIADLGVWVESGDSYDTSLFGVSLAGFAGTPSYMSPEQMRGEALTSASDLHTVGSLLWQLATGSVPYPMRSGPLVDTMKERMDRLRVPRECPPSMPDDLYRILRSSLAFAPQDRTFVNLPLDATTGPPQEKSAIRDMEKALQKFINQIIEQQQQAFRDFRSSIEAAERDLGTLQATLSQARAFVKRSEDVEQSLAVARNSRLGYTTLQREVTRIHAAISTIKGDMTTAFGDASAAALAEAQKDLTKERARADDERRQAQEAKASLAVQAALAAQAALERKKVEPESHQKIRRAWLVLLGAGVIVGIILGGILVTAIGRGKGDVALPDASTDGALGEDSGSVGTTTGGSANPPPAATTPAGSATVTGSSAQVRPNPNPSPVVPTPAVNGDPSSSVLTRQPAPKTTPPLVAAPSPTNDAIKQAEQKNKDR